MGVTMASDSTSIANEAVYNTPRQGGPPTLRLIAALRAGQPLETAAKTAGLALRAAEVVASSPLTKALVAL